MKTGTKRTLKILLFSALIVISLLFANGFYFVFRGQFVAWEKVKSGKELNYYETFSVYTMHSALWMLFWWASPGAANEVFMMQMCNKRGEIVRHSNKLILRNNLSPKILATMKSLSPGQSKRVSWNGNVSYGLNNPEHKAAMTLNPCIVSREIDKVTGKPAFFIRLDNTWPVHSETRIVLFKNKKIVMQEGLFRYLQDKHIVNNFIDEYMYPEEEIIALF